MEVPQVVYLDFESLYGTFLGDNSEISLNGASIFDILLFSIE